MADETTSLKSPPITPVVESGSAPLSEPQAASSSGRTRLASLMVNDARSYLLEYYELLASLFPCLKDSKWEAGLLDEREKMDAMIEDNDVVVFAKGGCGYCERAKEALAKFQLSTPFTLKVS